MHFILKPFLQKWCLSMEIMLDYLGARSLFYYIPHGMLTHLPLGVSGSIHLLAVFPIPLFITAVKVMDLLNADALQNAASNVYSPQVS